MKEVGRQYKRWEQLFPDEKRQIKAQNPKWDPADFVLFQYAVNKDGTLSRARGSHIPTPEYEAVLVGKANKIKDEMLNPQIRTKGDLRDWIPGVRFSFSRD